MSTYPRRPYAPAENAAITFLRYEGLTWEQVGRLMRRSKAAVCQHTLRERGFVPSGAQVCIDMCALDALHDVAEFIDDEPDYVRSAALDYVFP